MSILWASLALLAGLALLTFSADVFTNGASSLARRLGTSPLFIGMIIVGFGTSAPEILVAVTASFGNQGGIALGNAYGSNIANIALILGLTALIRPIPVSSEVFRRALPVLMLVSLLAVYQFMDTRVSRWEALILLLVFSLLIFLYLIAKDHSPSLQEREEPATGIRISTTIIQIIIGLIFLLLSSQILVKSAVFIAKSFGISDLIIGLSIVAVGTSLPELASSLMAAYKKEHAIALGNIIGSNIFNTLIVVGCAAMVRPISTGRELLTRDLSIMTLLTASLFIICYGFKKPGSISRVEGVLLIFAYCGYTGWLIHAALN